MNLRTYIRMYVCMYKSLPLASSICSSPRLHPTPSQVLAEKYEALQPEVAVAVAAAEVFAISPPEGEEDNDEASSTSSSALSDTQQSHKKKKPKSKKGKKGPPPSPSAGRRRSSDDRRSPRDADQKDGAASPKTGTKKGFDNGASPEASFDAVSPPVPSGPYLHHQLQKVKGLSDGTKKLLDDWRTKATNGLEDAVKFEEDYDSLYQWLEGTKAEAEGLGPVGVTEERILEQIAAVEVREGNCQWLSICV